MTDLATLGQYKGMGPTAVPFDPGQSASPLTPTFRELFEDEFSYVCQTVRRLGVREHDIEDVAHDVFVVVHRKLAEFDPRMRVRPWLFGIAFRAVAAYRRRRKYRNEAGDEPEPIHAGPYADEEIEKKQRNEVLYRVLDSMHPDRRAVFVMHSIDGHTIPEIASSLEIPVNTAYSRLRLAREEFALSAKNLVPERGGV